MILYLIVGLILALASSALIAFLIKKNVDYIKDMFGDMIDVTDNQFSITVVIINSILFLILWRVMIFVLLLILGLLYIHKKVFYNK